MDYSPRGSPSMEFFIQKYWGGSISSSRGSSRPRGWTISCDSCIGKWILYHCSTWEALISLLPLLCIFFTGEILILCFTVMTYCLFFSAYRSPFNISYKADLVVVKSFRFCLFGKLFISLSIMNDNLGGQSVLGLKYFALRTLAISCLSFLACKYSAETCDSLLGFLLYMTSCFSFSFNRLCLCYLLTF